MCRQYRPPKRSTCMRAWEQARLLSEETHTLIKAAQSRVSLSSLTWARITCNQPLAAFNSPPPQLLPPTTFEPRHARFRPVSRGRRHGTHAATATQSIA
ncbi:hypothetical protein CC85DRAFT_131761 [Cutaneotrichosporon oleaginosum]|uniref:Uncharacterized protein n=1 Tax=Cutaneotrichosporon oleaginosum TaxID=879819 RepID=A0A0J0XIV6_9TREE|nr:uncharacterized protein CC85DRAFT_131761 [Cutaneotrichosporon oleaginosum]KLT40997.1 hypothetical protein CC85DRAFT_131761 [Cutaneotrichosporon oleaginosum]TXT06262.1 hypothetical protein COLE_05593 [Cutaneotrichosporon oleaginosum]